MAWIELTTETVKTLYNTDHIVSVEDRISGGARLEFSVSNARGSELQHVYVNESKDEIEALLNRANLTIIR